jgi:hypothetical protein
LIPAIDCVNHAKIAIHKDNPMASHLDDLLYTVKDDKSPDFPAITVLLHRVCNGDQGKFEEATRLIGLYMEAAFAEGLKYEGSLTVDAGQAPKM